MRRAALLVTAAILAAAPAVAPAAGGSAAPPVPVLAYYYIWFNASSWNRAKVDFPLLGRYSSDEVSVMRRQVAWAKRAGITGFLVSWKSTPTLDRRLATLVRVADDAGFTLGIVYQGLDFARDPLPVARVGQDLDLLLRRYGRDRAFDIFGRPLIVLSGSWRYSARQIARLTAPRRSRALILASEKNATAYRRVAHVVDGDAYYWSSVDPATFPGYHRRLRRMGEVVHGAGGLWIAPAAPGFDARLVGGTRIVARRGGGTLREELSAAMSSSPDAVGLISWNEFSENSQVEPSVGDHGSTLAVLAQALGAQPPDIAPDSSDASGASGTGAGLPLAAAALAVAACALTVVVRRGRGPAGGDPRGAGTRRPG